MPTLPATEPLRRRRRSRFAPRALRLASVLLVTGLAVLAGYWYWQRATLDRTVDLGLKLVRAARTPAERLAALAEWERQTRGTLRERADDLIRHVFASGRLADPETRALLTWVAGVEYGDRLDDWRKWYETHQRLRRGKPPRVAARQQVKLDPVWRAPIGLTAWFTTILPLDGQIFVPSLGSSFTDDSDAGDGVVRIDGQSGQAELIFQPPDGPPRDILGLAAGDRVLFAACRNGYLYAMDPEGELRWKVWAGDRLAGPPLSFDVDRDGTSDAIVAAADGRVVALDGRTGAVLWASADRGGQPRSSAEGLGAVLAAGRLTGDQRQEILATLPDGRLRVLSAKTGEVRWSGNAGSDVLAGPILSGGRSEGPPAYVADRDARVWSLVRGGGSVKAVLAWDLLGRPGEGCVAAPRLLARSGRPPLLVICPTSAYSDLRASVCALEPEGVRWCYAPGGTIWATPALADVNGDRRTELVVASIDTDSAGQTVGGVSVLSSEGHCLRRIELPAPIECPPVVADVDQDDRLEVLVADQAGWLHCLTTGRIGPIEWGLAGGDSHNTRDAENAFRYGQRSAGMQWGWKPE